MKPASHLVAGKSPTAGLANQVVYLLYSCRAVCCFNRTSNCGLIEIQVSLSHNHPWGGGGGGGDVGVLQLPL